MTRTFSGDIIISYGRDHCLTSLKERNMQVHETVSCALRPNKVMVASIDKTRTGKQIRKYMNLRGISAQDFKSYLSLGCVQSVYRWLDGQNLPSLDSLYALSELLMVPMDLLIAGSREYHPSPAKPEYAERLLRYYMLLQEYMAA